MPAFCKHCNATIDGALESTNTRLPCQICGSLERRYEDVLSSRAVAGSLMKTKCYAAGLSRKKGLRFETTDGDSYSVTLKRFVKVSQLVDHDNDRYVKKVVDPVIGETLRDVDKPLSDHQGRGTAKKRD